MRKLRRIVDIATIVLTVVAMSLPVVAWAQTSYLYEYLETDTAILGLNDVHMPTHTLNECQSSAYHMVTISSGRGGFVLTNCFIPCACPFVCTGSLCEYAQVTYTLNPNVQYNPDSGTLNFSGQANYTADFDSSYVTAISLSGSFLMAQITGIIDEPIIHDSFAFIIGLFFARKLVNMIIKMVGEQNMFASDKIQRQSSDTMMASDEQVEGSEGDGAV